MFPTDILLMDQQFTSFEAILFPSDGEFFLKAERILKLTTIYRPPYSLCTVNDKVNSQYGAQRYV